MEIFDKRSKIGSDMTGSMLLTNRFNGGRSHSNWQAPPISRYGYKPLKTKIFKILKSENIKIQEKRRTKSRSYFDAVTVRGFIDSQPELKNSMASQNLMEKELCNPSIRRNLRHYFSEKRLKTATKTAKEGFFKGHASKPELALSRKKFSDRKN